MKLSLKTSEKLSAYVPCEYKGFLGKIKHDKEYNLFYVECEAVRESILGNTQEEAELNFKASVDAILSC